MEDIVERQPGAFRDIFAEFGWKEKALDVFRSETQNWMVKVQNELDLKRTQKIIGLERELTGQKNLLLKVQMLSALLRLSSGTTFHERNQTALIQLALRLIKQAAKHEQVDRWTRKECLECADSIVCALNLSDQQLGFLLEQLFAASTWKHGIRSPECLAQAMVTIGCCITKFSDRMSDDALNTVLQKCCCNLESDYLQIRLESI